VNANEQTPPSHITPLADPIGRAPCTPDDTCKFAAQYYGGTLNAQVRLANLGMNLFDDGFVCGLL
jgi:hypothetical protein